MFPSIPLRIIKHFSNHQLTPNPILDNKQYKQEHEHDDQYKNHTDINNFNIFRFEHNTSNFHSKLTIA